VATRTETDWTCARCGVTVSWSSGERKRKLPDNWSKEKGGVYCLGCRREMAGEAVLEELPEDASGEIRRKADVAARIEFELSRDPDAADGQIAKACRTSVASVRKTRERLANGNNAAI
jgi:hypothetical protein